jgi:hypothetical protein
MDDVAASQQLMSEKGMRAGGDSTNGGDMTLSQLDGSHDPSSPIQKKRKRNSTQKLAKKSIAIPPTAPTDMLAQSEVPVSSPFPFPATQPEPESPAVNGFAHSTAVEVPDSQIPGQPAHPTASSPMSSHVIPCSATKSKRTPRKSKQTKRHRAVSDAMEEADVDQDGDTAMVADEAVSPSHTPSKDKRPQTDDAGSRSHKETEVASGSKPAHSHLAAAEDADGTPGLAKRRKIGTPTSLTTIRDLIQDGEDEDAEQPRHFNKSKLKRIKKPQTPVAKSRDVYEIPDDDPRSTNGLANDKETSTRKPHSLKKTDKTKQHVYDSPAPVRTPGQPSGENEDEHSIMREPESSDEADGLGQQSDSNHNTSIKKKEKKTKRRSSVKKATSRRESGRYSYKGKAPPVGTAAERALGTAHDLQYPPDLRTSGDFTPDEEELIRRAIKDYQQRKGLEVSELVEIIQWNSHDPSFNPGDGTVSSKSDWTPQDIEDSRESAEFWDDIKHINTQRTLDRLRRHIRQTYHQFKRGAWTEEDDKRLRNLYGMHPNKWKIISVGMGDRSMHDCQNRWRDYLQYGDKLKSSRWDQEEEELFIRAVTTVAQRDEDHRAEQGLPPVEEYTIKDINWQQVSGEMNNTRSRIQVVQKWRNLQKREIPPYIPVERKPRKERSTSSEPTPPEPTPKKRGRGRPKGEEGATPKSRSGESQEAIDNSDDEEVQALPPPKKAKRPRKSEGTETNKSRKFRTTETDEIVDDSGEEGQANKEPDSPPKKKKRRKSRKSEATEADEDEQSRDVIEDPDKEIHADQPSKTSPLPKKPGRPRKSDTFESNEPNERTQPEMPEESVADLELASDDESEHAEDDDKVVEETQSGPALDVDGDQAQESGDDDEQRETDEASDEQDEASAAPIASQDQSPKDDMDGAQKQNEDSIIPDEPIESDDDQPSVAPSSPSRNVDDAQSDEDSDDAQSDEDSEDAQPDKDSEDARAKEKGESSGENEVQPSITSINSDSPKPIVSAATKMQWGDKFDMVLELSSCRPDEEGDIDWDGIAEKLATNRNYMWSPKALQSMLDLLIQQLRNSDKEVDMDDLPGTMDDLLDFITNEYREEIDDFYDLS